MCYNENRNTPCVARRRSKRGEPTPFLRELDFKASGEDFERHPLKDKGSTQLYPTANAGFFLKR